MTTRDKKPKNGTVGGTPARRTHLTPSARAKRDSEIFELSLACLSVRDIAAEVGVSKSTVARAVTKELRRYAEDNRRSISEMIDIENERLNEMQRAIAPRVRAGDLPAMAMALKIMVRRAKMNGFDLTRAEAADDAAFVVRVDDRAAPLDVLIDPSVFPQPMDER